MTGKTSKAGATKPAADNSGARVSSPALWNGSVPPAGANRPQPGTRSGLASFTRHTWVRLAAAALTGAVVVTVAVSAVGALRGDEYSSESLVLVNAEEQSLESGLPVAAVWTQVATSDTVVVPVAAEVGADVEDLRRGLTVTQSQSAPLIAVRVTAPTAAQAAEWANALADELIARSASDPVDAFELQQVTAAQEPVAADATLERTALTAAPFVGGLVGLVVGQQLVRRRRRS
jgi:capsular polysaccharide biosynthesis protein